MNTSEFIEILIEDLELEDVDLTPNTDLTELDEYDSLAVMSIIAIADEHFETKLTAGQLADITTVKSLMNLIGSDKFE